MRPALPVVLLCWLLAPAFLAGDVPLPKDMEASFAHVGSAARFTLLTSGSRWGVKLSMNFANAAHSAVVVQWEIHDNGPYGHERQTLATSFKPTALARRAGTSNDFYVVGWSEKTARVIVEKWSVPALVSEEIGRAHV